MRSCPKCKAKEYNNRFFTLMINECGHSLCKSCVDNLFARNSGPCPTCGRTLKKNQFWEQSYDDPMIEKENFIRKKLRKIYNLCKDDFPTLRAYNDYLEHFEQLVWKLSRDEEIEQTQNEIERFRNANAELIERNRKRLTPDELWIDEQLEAVQKKGRGALELEKEEQNEPESIDARAIIEELKTSSLPAEVILDRKRKLQIEADLTEKERQAKRKKELRMQRTLNFVPIREDGQRYHYVPPILFLNGPFPPPPWELASLGFLVHMRSASDSQKAGGFTTELGCYRALFDSRCDLNII